MTDEIERVAAPERIWAEPGLPGYTDEPNELYTVGYVRADLMDEAMQPDDDDDGDMLTIAYLAGAHDAKRALRPSGPPAQVTVRGSSVAKDRPITPQDAAKLLTDAGRENIVDEIESIISETHDMDVRDVDYAENIVSWLERHHPAALRAIAGEDQT